MSVAQQNIKITLHDSDSQATPVSVTITNATSGRKARCWLSLRIKPNGKAEATLNVLGKFDSSDTHRSLTMPWHDLL